MRTMRALLVAALAGCAPSDEGPPSWEEFHEQAYREPDTGLWIVNGDEPVATVAELRSFYDRHVASVEPGDVEARAQPLTVHQINGVDSRWSASQALNITYCVRRAPLFFDLLGGFSSQRYTQVVEAMNAAAADWERVARVNFIHVSTLDATCSTSSGVVFNVRQVTTFGSYLASAFFPDHPRSQRQLKIDTAAFGAIAPRTLRGLVRHELGHTLGFRHEHTRPEAGTCFEDNGWRALTPYDSASVMHYPQCNGTNTGDLVLTALDAQGAASLYPR